MEKLFRFNAHGLTLCNFEAGVQCASWEGSVYADSEVAARLQVERLIQIEALSHGRALVGRPEIRLSRGEASGDEVKAR
jgi:hypothetical protein